MMHTTKQFQQVWLALVLGCAVTASHAEGVDVGKLSVFRNLVPADQVEQQATAQYTDLKQQAASQRALAPASHPQTIRLRAIAQRMIPYAPRFNSRAAQWQWEVNLIGSKQLNAFCMPGGKIAVYTGLLETLKLTDDEVAVVMGHEIAHALREHARERIGKSQATQLGVALLNQNVGGGKYGQLFQAGGSLLNLKFSRGDESEADTVGLELAARAGYDPRAGITLWQKMMSQNAGAPPEWLSTHPSGSSRIAEIRSHLPQVMPLYEQARAGK
ncbi:MAG: M48 family metallopeptidase [Pseudomonadota bacterium]